jgi:hypothetical protein
VTGLADRLRGFFIAIAETLQLGCQVIVAVPESIATRMPRRDIDELINFTLDLGS